MSPVARHGGSHILSHAELDTRADGYSPDMDNTAVERLTIDTIRGLAMDMVEQADAGHPGTAMALAPLGYLLFLRLRLTRRPRLADLG